MRSHEFDARLEWLRGGEGAAARNHRVEFEGRPTLEVSAAAAYKGDATRLNPEELFLASLASCQLLSYLTFAPSAGVTVLAYEDRARATLAIVERKMRVAEVVLRPRITVDAATDRATALALVERAHDACFIASSVRTTVRVEADVVTG